MKFKHIHFIINPAAAADEPILSLIHQTLKDTKTDWDVSLTKPNLDAGEIAKKLIGKTDLIAVYGGDGCVTTVAAALQGTKTPMLILPGGTANVMAKELGITNTATALELINSKQQKVRAIDMGTVNGEPFLLRVNLGIMADMVLEADRKLKEQIGQLAYGLTTVKTIANAKPCDYQLTLDKKQIKTSGVSLTVTNSGNMGVVGLELQPGISVTDGRLDVVLLKNNDWLSVAKVAGSALLHQNSDAIAHWRCRTAEIELPKKMDFICDDAPRKARKLRIEVKPKAIRFIVPAQPQK